MGEKERLIVKTLDNAIKRSNRLGGIFLNNRLLYGNGSFLYRTTSPSELTSLRFYGQTRIPNLSMFKSDPYIAPKTVAPSKSHGVVGFTKGLPFWKLRGDNVFDSPVVLTLDGSGRSFRPGSMGNVGDLTPFEDIPSYLYSIGDKNQQIAYNNLSRWSIGIPPSDKQVQAEDLSYYLRGKNGYLYMGRVIPDKRIETQILVSEPYAKMSRDGSYINEAFDIYTQGKPGLVFLVVKDNEPNYYSLHFKTDLGSLTEPEKLAMTRKLVQSIPSGSFVRTHGNVSPGAANMFFGRLQRAGLQPTGLTFDVGMKSGWTDELMLRYNLQNNSGTLKFPMLYKYYYGGKF